MLSESPEKASLPGLSGENILQQEDPSSFFGLLRMTCSAERPRDVFRRISDRPASGTCGKRQRSRTKTAVSLKAVFAECGAGMHQAFLRLTKLPERRRSSEHIVPLRQGSHPTKGSVGPGGGVFPTKKAARRRLSVRGDYFFPARFFERSSAMPFSRKNMTIMTPMVMSAFVVLCGAKPIIRSIGAPKRIAQVC